MYAFVQGKLYSKNSGEVVVNCSGVGYLINTSLQTFEKLPNVNEEVFLHTYLIVREDSHQLYGFLNTQELELFKLLISISGVGPKVALGILSSVTPSILRDSIIRNDLLKLQKLPGIGKKTAERLVLELKDKIQKVDIQSNDDSSSKSAIDDLTLFDEATSALIALGYNKTLAEKAVKQSENDFQRFIKQVKRIIDEDYFIKNHENMDIDLYELSSVNSYPGR